MICFFHNAPSGLWQCIWCKSFLKKFTIPETTAVLAIGPVTSDALKEAGITPDMEAGSFDIPGIIKEAYPGKNSVKEYIKNEGGIFIMAFLSDLRRFYGTGEKNPAGQSLEEFLEHYIQPSMKACATQLIL